QAGRDYPDTFAAYRAAQQSFSQMSMYWSGLLRVEARSVTADGVVEGVSPEYFHLLGARAAAGRFLTDADAREPVALISDRFRQRIFGDGRGVIGETMKIDGKPVTVIGVTAPGFEGLSFDGGTDLFQPIAVARSLSGDTRPLRARYIVGRLRRGVTLAQARAELHARWRVIQEATLPPYLPAAEQQALRSQRIELESVASGFSGLRMQYGTSLVVLVALTGGLLTI